MTTTAEAKAPAGDAFARGKTLIDLIPDFAWPTVILWVAVLATHVGIVAAAIGGIVSFWLATPVLGAICYAHYTFVHDSIHGAVACKKRTRVRIEKAMGWVGSLALLESYPFLKREHLLHHAHTNTADDPDHFVAGPLRRLFIRWFLSTGMRVLPFRWMLGYKHRQALLARILKPDERRLARRLDLAIATAFWLALASPWRVELLLLWFVPGRLGMLLLHVFFQWLPHHPFDTGDRLSRTRLALWPGSTVTLLSQDLHLIHHLRPKLPFYRYPAAVRRLMPELLEGKARIGGLLVGPTARDRTHVAVRRFGSRAAQ